MVNKLSITAFVLSLIAVGAVLMGGGETVREVKEVETVKEVGSTVGPDVMSRYFFREGATQGGRTATTTPDSLSSYTTERTDFNRTPTVIDWTPNKNITVSVSGTSTHAYVPNVGDTATTYWRNASSTAASQITFAAADAGVDIQHADGGNLVLQGLDWGKVTFIRESQNLVTVLFDEMTEGD